MAAASRRIVVGDLIAIESADGERKPGHARALTQHRADAHFSNAGPDRWNQAGHFVRFRFASAFLVIMNPNSRFVRSVSAPALLALALPAVAVEPLSDLAAVARWVADSASCRADFLVGLQDRKFLDRLAALGVVLQTDWQEGDVPEGEFTTPQPVRIAGQPAKHFRYWGDSGAEFYAIVAAAPDALAKDADAKPVPARLKKDFDERTVAMRFTRAARKGERLAPALFVRRGEKAGETEVGCRQFDG